MKNQPYLLTLIIVILSACAPLPLPTPTPTPTAWDAPTATETQIISGASTVEPTKATLQLALYPPEARTGLPELDAIIDALLRHDFVSIKELTSYLEIGCTSADGLGGPPKCQQGESEGTSVEVVPFLGPEGHHSRRADYESWQGPDVLGLLAAYRTSPGTYADPAYPAGEYALVFLLPGGPETLTLQVTGGRIVRYDYQFGGQTERDLLRKAEEIILPLSFNPIPTAVPWNLFSDPGGRFSFVYPPALELMPADLENSWQIGNRIRVEILDPGKSWITCFDQALGDCPFVESDEQVLLNDQDVRRVKGYIGAVGGNTPQEFLCYIFNLADQALVMTVYALPFGIQVSDPNMIWPLEGMELELFERTVETVIISE